MRTRSTVPILLTVLLWLAPTGVIAQQPEVLIASPVGTLQAQTSLGFESLGLESSVFDASFETGPGTAVGDQAVVLVLPRSNVTSVLDAADDSGAAAIAAGQRPDRAVRVPQKVPAYVVWKSPTPGRAIVTFSVMPDSLYQGSLPSSSNWQTHGCVCLDAGRHGARAAHLRRVD